jgi:hypothetical protein
MHLLGPRALGITLLLLLVFLVGIKRHATDLDHTRRKNI